MWMIRSLFLLDNKGKPKYWSSEVGWTWKDHANTFTDEEKATAVIVPANSVWELQE